MKHKLHLTHFLAVLLMVFSGATMAEKPSLRYVELGYGVIGMQYGPDPLGVNFLASYELNENWYIPLSYFKYSENDRFRDYEIDGNMLNKSIHINTDFDLSELYIGVGYQFKKSPTSIITVELNYVQVGYDGETKEEIIVYENNIEISREIQESSNSERDSGISAKVNYRQRFSTNIQAGIGLEHRYVRVDSENVSETSLNIDFMYFITERISAKFALATYNTQKSHIFVSGRYNF